METQINGGTSNLEKSILHTLAFFAAQEKVLTLLELRDALVKVGRSQPVPGLSELRELLSFGLKGKVLEKNGLYCLESSSGSLDLRPQKYRRTMALFRKARRWAGGLKHLPYIRAAAISGSGAQNNASPVSDIDLFIIVQPERVFLARFFASLYFQIFGGRRYGQKTIGRFCLNHYVADGFTLDADRNLYTAMEYSSLMPIFGGEYLEKFWENNFFWIREFLVGPRLPQTSVFGFDEKPGRFQKFCELLLCPAAGGLERLLGFLQKRRIKPSDFVIVTENELSFHPESKGQRILGRFREILGHLPPG